MVNSFLVSTFSAEVGTCGSSPCTDQSLSNQLCLGNIYITSMRCGFRFPQLEKGTETVCCSWRYALLTKQAEYNVL